MSDTTICYNLLESTPTGIFSVRNGFTSKSDARLWAINREATQAVTYELQLVVTTRSIEECFTIPRLAPPTLAEIAEQMSEVYASSIDWEYEDYVALSDSDKLQVRDLMETDSCDNCGWDFNHHYLNDGICDFCESELEQEEDENDEE